MPDCGVGSRPWSQQLVQAQNLVAARDRRIARADQELVQRRRRLALLDDVERPGDQALIGEPVVAADRHLPVARRIPRDADRRREVVVVAFEPFQVGSGPGLQERDRSLAAIERPIRLHLHPGGIVRHGVQLVANAGIEREVRLDAPVVLHVEVVFLHALIERQRLERLERRAVAVEHLIDLVRCVRASRCRACSCCGDRSR